MEVLSDAPLLAVAGSRPGPEADARAEVRAGGQPTNRNETYRYDGMDHDWCGGRTGRRRPGVEHTARFRPPAPGRAAGTHQTVAQFQGRQVQKPAFHRPDELGPGAVACDVGFSLCRPDGPGSRESRSGAEDRSEAALPDVRRAGVVRSLLLPASVGRKAYPRRSGLLPGGARVVPQPGFPRNGALQTRRDARDRLPDYHARPLGSPGLPDRRGSEGAGACGDLSAGGR